MTARITGGDLSGSAMDRVERCPASAALPQVYDAHEREHRDRGTAIHGFLDRVAQLRREGQAAEDARAAALAEVDEQWRATCEGVELAQLEGLLHLSTEVAVAYNWREDTARLLKPAGHRLYEFDPATEIPATLDVIGSAPREVYIGDYKGPYGWLPEPEQSMQLGLGAVAVARMTRARAATVEYIRIRDDGTTRRFGGRLDVFQLDAVAERIGTTMRRVEALRVATEAGTVPNVTEGPWCRYCPAKAHCPAKTAAMRAVLANHAPVSLRDPITPEVAASVYQRVREAKDALSQLEAAVYAYARTSPIPLGVDEDGALRFFGELRRPGNDSIDGAVAHRVLTRRYGGEAANQAVTMEVTKKALGEVIRANLADGEKVTRVTAEVLEEIREANGITARETCTTTEYTVAPDGETKAKKRRAA